MSNLWTTCTAAPHRVMFLAGVVQTVATVVWWGLDLAARQWGGGEGTAVYGTGGHAWLMLLGLFPLLMFGFLMTTYPRWMVGPEIPRRDYVGAFLLLSVGVVLFYMGLYLGASALAAALVLHMSGLVWAASSLWRVFRRAGPTRDRRYESQLNVAMLLAIAADAAFLGWIVFNDARFLQAAMTGALWLFLIPVLVLVAHRMVPFFSSAVLPGYVVVQPRWSFPLLWCGVGLHFLLEMLEMRGWFWLADGPLLFLSLHHSVHWRWRRALAVPLLGALHVAFGFLSLGLALSMAQSLWFLETGDVILFRAPLHAIGIGFIGGMTVAMVTRVSRGHSGRTLEMGGLDRLAFGAVLVAAVVRISAELLPLGGWSPVPLSLLAALVWVFGLSPWVVRYAAVYLLPRPDGKPG